MNDSAAALLEDVALGDGLATALLPRDAVDLKTVLGAALSFGFQGAAFVDLAADGRYRLTLAPKPGADGPTAGVLVAAFEAELAVQRLRDRLRAATRTTRELTFARALYHVLPEPLFTGHADEAAGWYDDPMAAAKPWAAPADPGGAPAPRDDGPNGPDAPDAPDAPGAEHGNG